jgi:hypothetical protein
MRPLSPGAASVSAVAVAAVLETMVELADMVRAIGLGLMILGVEQARQAGAPV